MLTAKELFFEAADNGQVPAAIPIMTIDGVHHGLATYVMEIKHSHAAENMVMSEDPQTRALAAIYAIYESRRAVSLSESLIDPA